MKKVEDIPHQHVKEPSEIHRVFFVLAWDRYADVTNFEYFSQEFLKKIKQHGFKQPDFCSEKCAYEAQTMYIQDAWGGRPSVERRDISFSKETLCCVCLEPLLEKVPAFRYVPIAA